VSEVTPSRHPLPGTMQANTTNKTTLSGSVHRGWLRYLNAPCCSPVFNGRKVSGVPARSRRPAANRSPLCTTWLRSHRQAIIHRFI